MTHRHDLSYPASYPGETIDVNLQIHPIKYSPDGSITIAAVPLAVSQKGNSLLLSGKNIEIEILRSLWERGRLARGHRAAPIRGNIRSTQL